MTSVSISNTLTNQSVWYFTNTQLFSISFLKFRHGGRSEQSHSKHGQTYCTTWWVITSTYILTFIPFVSTLAYIANDFLTACTEYADVFQRAIVNYVHRGGQEFSQEEVKKEAKEGEIQVYIRKRPIFAPELKDGEFDVCSCVRQDTVVSKCVRRVLFSACCVVLCCVAHRVINQDRGYCCCCLQFMTRVCTQTCGGSSWTTTVSHSTGRVNNLTRNKLRLTN